MIDCFHFSENELTRLGITFTNPVEAKEFINYIKQRLDTIIGEELMKKLQTDDDHDNNMLISTRILLERKNAEKEWPEYPLIVKKAQVELIWNVFLHRDELERATINHGVDKAETTLQEVGVSNPVCLMFNVEGINTIGDILKSDKLSHYECNAPEMYFELKSSILDYLFPDPPQKKIANTEPRNVRSQRIDDVFFKCSHKSPYDVLEELQNYIQSQAYAYCNGECTLNEFIIQTYSPLVARKLVNAKYNTSFRSAAGYEENLIKCYYSWKNIGIIPTDYKLDELFPHSDDISKTLEWFFYVIDKLLIPIEYFFPLSYFCELEEEEYPNLITEIRNTTERLTLTEDCLDIDKLIEDPGPKNKTFNFVFTDETTATITIREVGSTFYRGIGIIYDYMSEPGEIEIENDNNGYWFYFDKKVFPEIDVVLMTTEHPVPHPRWDKYNSAVKKRKKLIKEKYDEKRSNYLKSLF